MTRAPRLTPAKLERLADRASKAAEVFERCADELYAVTRNPRSRHAWLVRDAAAIRDGLREARREADVVLAALRAADSLTAADAAGVELARLAGNVDGLAARLRGLAGVVR